MLLRALARSAVRTVGTHGARYMSVSVSSGGGDGQPSRFRQQIEVGGKHKLVADEPEQVGGKDEGPSPYDLLLSALGACTNMTIRMYAERKGIPLESVSVDLKHSKVYAKDCAACADEVKDKGKLRIDHISREITLHGSKLSAADKANCLRIANMCPVHKTLEQSAVVSTSLRAQAAPLLLHIAGRSAELSPGFSVQRVIPFHKKRAVGPWVFCDHYGPVDVSGQGGAAEPMDVAPHPHIGVATLSFLFSGAILHRDSIGVEKMILPGAVNYMSSGRGVVHSERGRDALPHFAPDPEGKKMLHGLQMWIGLPREHEDEEPNFHHAAQVPDISGKVVVGGAGSARLVMGAVGDDSLDAIPQLWPIFMVTAELEAGARMVVPLRPKHEACVYCCEGGLVSGAEKSSLGVGESAVYGAPEGGGEEEALSVEVEAVGACRVAVFGGLPLPEPRHMFWNFAHSDRSKVEAAAEAWRHLDRTKFPPVVNEKNDDSVPLPSPAGRAPN